MGIYSNHHSRHFGAGGEDEPRELVPPRLLTPEQFLALSPNKRLLAVKENIEFAREYWDQGPVVHAGHQKDSGHWCNTTLCTAGWALFLAGDIRISPAGKVAQGSSGGWAKRAQELLGIENDDQDMLFYVDEEHWPELIERILAENAD